MAEMTGTDAALDQRPREKKRSTPDSSTGTCAATEESSSDARYRSLFASINEGFALCEMIVNGKGEPVDYRILDANAATAAILGIPAEAAIGRTVRELVPDVEAEWIATCARAGLGGESIRLEQYMPWFDQWIEIYLTPTGTAGDGQFGAIYNDRTAQKRAEEALQRSEERQAFLLELSDALRPLTNPVAVQEAASRIVGEHLEVARAAYGEVEPGDEFMTVERDWHRADTRSTVGRFRIDDFGTFFTGPLRAGHVAAIEDVLNDERIRAAAHAKSWGLIGVRSAIACPIVKQGRFVAAFFIHHDQPRSWSDDEVALVSEVADRTWEAVERARAEAALRQSEEMLRRALEIETVGVVFFDLAGTITEANDAFRRMAGGTAEQPERSQLRLDELTPPEWEEASARAIEELRMEGRSIPYEREYFRSDGSRWPALSAATMLTATQGVEFILDLSELHAAEESAREARERRDRLEREFVANAAHELRTPLTAIIGAVDALNNGAKDNPAVRERFLGHLQRESTRLARLSDSLLLLAQAESLQRPERSQVAIRRLLEEVAAEFELPEAVTLHVTAPRTLEAVTHRGLVERIVTNLLENAVKHTASGRIELQGRATAASVLIEVRDTGSGISGEAVERAFDRFYRGETRSLDGFGLGLSIAMQAAIALDGLLKITPRRGGGTVARLVLPIGEATPDRRSARAAG